MEVTEVKVRIVRDGGKEKLRAFASITLDNAFVVREVKVIDGDKGLFVAMPSRKVTDKCRKCNTRNVAQSNYCNGCGEKLSQSCDDRSFGGGKLYMDVAHPINSECRSMIHDAVIGAYNEAVARKHDKAEENSEADNNYEDYDDVRKNEEDTSTKEENTQDISKEDTEQKQEETAGVSSDSGDAFNKGIFT